MQQRQQYSYESNNYQNKRKRSKFSENGYDAKRCRYEDDYQPGRFEQRNRINWPPSPCFNQINGCNSRRNDSCSEKSSSPNSSDGSQIGHRINEYQENFQSKRLERRSRMEKSPRRSPSINNYSDSRSRSSSPWRWHSPSRSPSPDSSRCEMKREQVDFLTIKTNFNYKPFGYQNAPPQTRHYATEDNTESQCIYCTRHHLSDMCPDYPVVAVRRVIMVKKHICHICLQSNQRNHRCERMEECFYCKRINHHSSVCHFPVLHTYCEEELAVFKDFAWQAGLSS